MAPPQPYSTPCVCVCVCSCSSSPVTATATATFVQLTKGPAHLPQVHAGSPDQNACDHISSSQNKAGKEAGNPTGFFRKKRCRSCIQSAPFLPSVLVVVTLLAVFSFHCSVAPHSPFNCSSFQFFKPGRVALCAHAKVGVHSCTRSAMHNRDS